MTAPQDMTLGDLIDHAIEYAEDLDVPEAEAVVIELCDRSAAFSNEVATLKARLQTANEKLKQREELVRVSKEGMHRLVRFLEKFRESQNFEKRGDTVSAMRANIAAMASVKDILPLLRRARELES